MLGRDPNFHSVCAYFGSVEGQGVLAFGNAACSIWLDVNELDLTQNRFFTLLVRMSDFDMKGLETL